MATSQASIAVSYKTILLAIDFQSSSEAALPYVMNLARAFDAAVIAAHAVPFEPLAGLAAVPPNAEVDFEWQNATETMKAYQDTHPFTGVRHEFLLERGDACAVIADLVQDRRVDLVVVGTHGRSGLRKVFVGSVAEQIFRTVRCPVLTVGPCVEILAGWQPRHILFATEFAEGSLHALPHALAIAEANQAELVVVHTVPLVPWDQRSEMAELYKQRLQKLIPEGVAHSCSIRFEICFDLPAPGILATAQDKKTDLIVMGVHHAHFPRMDAHMPGTTACEVISKAHCPVLTVSNRGTQ